MKFDKCLPPCGGFYFSLSNLPQPRHKQSGNRQRTDDDMVTIMEVQAMKPSNGKVSEGLCAKNVLSEHDAVSEMKVGPSKPVCRCRLQTAVSCFSPKGCGGERYGKSRGKSRHVWIRETNEVNP